MREERTPIPICPAYLPAPVVTHPVSAMPACSANDSLSECSGSLGCMIVHGLLPLACADETLPDYCESGEVIATTPSQNDRYERQAL